MSTQDRKALILGVTGQDGAYLSQLLLERGYEVHGTSRNRETACLQRLQSLGIASNVVLHSLQPTDLDAVCKIFRDLQPTEIYNLASQSSVAASFEHPSETLESSVRTTINILEALRSQGIQARLYNASSSECFGNTPPEGADETTPFRPRSPYGVGKAAAHWAVANYREAYGLFSCSGILFNHESPLRPKRFVTQKIVRGAVDIAFNKADRLELGDLDIARDWGWAPEYVEAMAGILQLDEPDDFVVATGKMTSLRTLVRLVFDCLNLRWEDHVNSTPSIRRPTDITVSLGNPVKAKRVFGWQAQVMVEQIAERLVEGELRRRKLREA